MKILLSYPGIMPATAQVLQAFYENDWLHSFATTFVYQPNNPMQRRLADLLPSGLRAELNRRAISVVPPALVNTDPWLELMRVVLSRAGASASTVDRCWEKMVLSFDHKVAETVTSEVSAVYGYEHACRFTFERAEQVGAYKIYDLAAPHFTFLEKIIALEKESRPEHFSEDWKKIHAQDGRRNEHKSREFAAADLIVANSKFTAKTLIDAGYAASKICVVPLGGPAPSAMPAKRNGKVPVFFFVGNDPIRKGLPYLVEAWKSLGKVRGELLVAGSKLEKLSVPENVRLLGNIPNRAVMEQLSTASVLVLPSLCDGFGMVVTEALAHGVPVLTTTHTGAADLITEGKNGWVVPPANAVALAERLAWCLDHPEELEAMRESALRSARENTWAHYRTRLVETIESYFLPRPKEKPLLR